MAEKIVVARPRRQQSDCWVETVGATRQRRPQLQEEWRQPLCLAGGKDVAGDIAMNHAVGQRIADAGRRLGVGVDHAPTPIWPAGKVSGEELQKPARRPQVLAGPQEGWITK